METIKIIDINEIQKNNTYVIYGAGKVGQMVHGYLKRKGKRILAFCDGNPQKWNSRIKGARVLAPEECVKKYLSSIFIIANEKYYGEMMSTLENLGIGRCVLCTSFYEIKNMYILAGKYATENKHYIFDRPQRNDVAFHLYSVFFRMKGIMQKISMSRESRDHKRDKKYKVSLCLIFYNEGKYLKEWIEYHRIIGIDHFYLYNNNSTDNYMDVLKPYIDSGLVDVILWKDKPGQMTAYIDCARRYGEESDWIGFIDADEFIVPIEHNNIKDFLAKFNGRGSVYINWKCFGYNGKLDRNTDGLITEDFTQTTEKFNQLGKCFWNTKFAYRDNEPEDMMQIHYLRTIGRKGKLLPMVNCFDIVCNEEYQFAPKDAFPIQINHYMHKSYHEYCERKARGRATTTGKSYRNIYQFYQDESMINYTDKHIFKYLGKLKSAMLME